MIHYISIGPFCESANILGSFNLRQQAFPFDFMFSSLPMIRHIITDRCVTFLDKSHYSIREGGTYHAIYSNYIDTPILRIHHAQQNDTSHMVNTLKERPVFLHHNLLEEETYKAFQRRCERLLSVIDNHEKIVFVYCNLYMQDHHDVFEFADSFRDYPNIRVIEIATNQREHKIIYHGTNCRVYQDYNYENIFRDIEQTL
jgi:hypothetical protein